MCAPGTEVVNPQGRTCMIDLGFNRKTIDLTVALRAPLCAWAERMVEQAPDPNIAALAGLLQSLQSASSTAISIATDDVREFLAALLSPKLKSVYGTTPHHTTQFGRSHVRCTDLTVCYPVRVRCAVLCCVLSV
jgi:hypothetical protein